MRKIMANLMTVGGAGLFLWIAGQVHAGEITCPGVTQIQKTIEPVEARDDRQWERQRPMDVADPAMAQFNSAEFVVQEPDEQSPTQATIIYKLGTLNLTLEYLQAQGPALSTGSNRPCESPDATLCKLIKAHELTLSF
ncbi:DUF3757 domain-containing protein [Pseudomonas citrulli]|uniref:DUF3757 domain-containing protein n=1 Tax=Pseudomonas citrulli TaxID=3064347 RepID=A0ABT9BWT4_9PSED|nr:DUF3757 domain-containing protein [Pseudomonas sp. K18]MDO7896440.1 DUF3757 domain-containing protein [Pseudomonas sp. K18]